MGEISHFLFQRNPDIKVVVADNLCRPQEWQQVLEEHGKFHHLIVGACSRLARQNHFHRLAAKAGINPWDIRVVDLQKEMNFPFSSFELTERIKLLLWAQINRKCLQQKIGRENLKSNFWGLQEKISRRELLTMIGSNFSVIPSIEKKKCICRKGCRLCIDNCPLKAIAIEEDRVTIDKTSCVGCGNCVFCCPQQAIIYPTFSPEELSGEIEGLLFAESKFSEPKVIAVICQNCSPVFDEDGRDKLTYPYNILPLQVPCLAMASPWLILRAFERGAGGVAIISGRETCRAGFRATKWQENVQFLQELFECWEIDPKRVRIFEVSEKNCDTAGRELNIFAREVSGYSPILLRIPENNPLPERGQLLPGLIKNLDAGLRHSAKRTAAKGFVPFGVITVDSFKCTGCATCTLDCPTESLTLAQKREADAYQLFFRHDTCVACGRCVESCPENCLQLERVLELDRIGKEATVIFEDTLAQCCECGIPFSSRAMIESLKAKISASGGPTWQLDLCPACRIITIQPGKEKAAGTAQQP